VETVLGDFMVWMNDELDADNGYKAWIGGQELEDRTWKWTDGTAFQRQSRLAPVIRLFRQTLSYS